jgi:hypothetical protein
VVLVGVACEMLVFGHFLFVTTLKKKTYRASSPPS